MVILVMEAVWCSPHPHLGHANTAVKWVPGQKPEQTRGGGNLEVRRVWIAERHVQEMEDEQLQQHERMAEMELIRCEDTGAVDCLSTFALQAHLGITTSGNRVVVGVVVLVTMVVLAVAAFGLYSRAIPKKRGPETGRIVEIRYLNLKEKPERRQAMERQLKAINISHSRSNAYKVRTLAECERDPKLSRLVANTPSFEYDADCRDHKDDPLETRAAFVLSVYLSHMATYWDLADKHSSNDNTNINFSNIGEGANKGEDPANDAILVLEDDVTLDSSLQARYISVTDSLPKDWEVLRLGTWGEWREEDRVNSVIYRTNPPFYDPKVNKVFYGGAHAVAIRVTNSQPR